MGIRGLSMLDGNRRIQNSAARRADIPSFRESRGNEKSMLFPGLFLLLFLLLTLDLGEELIELLLSVCGYLGIDLDEVLGDLT